MFDFKNPAVWLIALVVCIAVVVLLRAYFSSEQRDRRRRERNHGRIICKTRRPMVSLAVQTKPEAKRRSNAG